MTKHRIGRGLQVTRTNRDFEPLARRAMLENQCRFPVFSRGPGRRITLWSVIRPTAHVPRAAELEGFRQRRRIISSPGSGWSVVVPRRPLSVDTCPASHALLVEIEAVAAE